MYHLRSIREAPNVRTGAERPHARLTGNLEGCKVSQIFAIDISPTEHIHHTINERRRAAFPCDRYISNALKLGPYIRREVETPRVIVVESSICSAKDIELVVVDYHDVTGPCGWRFVCRSDLLPLRYFGHCDDSLVRGCARLLGRLD